MRKRKRKKGRKQMRLMLQRGGGGGEFQVCAIFHVFLILFCPTPLLFFLMGHLMTSFVPFTVTIRYLGCQLPEPSRVPQSLLCELLRCLDASYPPSTLGLPDPEADDILMCHLDLIYGQILIYIWNIIVIGISTLKENTTHPWYVLKRSQINASPISA